MTEQSDIVEILRDQRFLGQESMRERAAGEIEHLLEIRQVYVNKVKVRDAEIERLKAALMEISIHWACQYDHPKKDTALYRGAYGIGVTDGHRACKVIADRALNETPVAPSCGCVFCDLNLPASVDQNGRYHTGPNGERCLCSAAFTDPFQHQRS